MHVANTNTFSPELHEVNSFNLSTLKPNSKIIVIGAGAFGGWCALSLLRKKFNVTLVDAWGPGNARSSSGDETRVIRSTYGNNEVYFDLNVRSLSLWKEYERQVGKKLFLNSGVLWMCYEETTPMVDDSIPFAQKHRMEYEYLSSNDLEFRYPSIYSNDLHHAYFDPFGGYLKARESCQLVRDTFVKEGGSFLLSSVKPGTITDNSLECIELSNGSKLNADVYIFACGSWLNKIFPQVLSTTITCSKQEVYYFGVPREHTKQFEQLPVWVDVDGKDFYYGIPFNDGRGFKIGVDKRGEVFDPTNDERTINTDVLAEARRFISHRFPALRNAPLLENRVCPYENSPDGNFIIDHHPESENVIIVGGGSGHGFKHGPAIGELVGDGLSEGKSIPGLFSLKRFR